MLAAAGVRASNELALPMGNGKTSPISAVDVARAVAVILDDPAPHIGQIYDLTGPENRLIWTIMRAFSPRHSAGPSDIAMSHSGRGVKTFGRRDFLSTSSGISRP